MGGAGKRRRPSFLASTNGWFWVCRLQTLETKMRLSVEVNFEQYVRQSSFNVLIEFFLKLLGAYLCDGDKSKFKANATPRADLGLNGEGNHRNYA